MRVFSMILTLAFLTGCGTWPDVPPSSTARGTGWPSLVPLEDLTAPRPAPDLQAQQDIVDRTAALRARAAILRLPAGDEDEMERLRQRLTR